MTRGTRRLVRSLGLVAGNLAVFLALILAVAVAAELWARTRPRNWFVAFDPLLGFRLKPGAEGVYRGLSFIHPRADMDTPVRINSRGMRGPDLPLEKPPGIRRVLMLGDSYVQALEVHYEDTFYARLGARARARGLPLEVVPMGVMGWGTAQEYLWLRDEGLRFQPDLVVLLFFLLNDQFDNSRGLNTNRGRPYFELRDGELELVSLPDERNRFKYFIADHFRSARVWTEVAQRVAPIFRSLQWLGMVDTKLAAEERGDYDALLRDAYDLTFALIEACRDLTEKSGSRFLVAYHGARETGTALTSDELVAHFCERSHLDCLNLNPSLDGRDEYFFPGDYHWTPAGHAIVADALWDASTRGIAPRQAGGARADAD